MSKGSSWPASLPFKEHLLSMLHFLLAFCATLESIVFQRRVHSSLSETEDPAAPVTVSTLAWPTPHYNKQCPRACLCPNPIWCWLDSPLKSEPKGTGRKPTSSLALLLSGQQNQSPLGAPSLLQSSPCGPHQCIPTAQSKGCYTKWKRKSISGGQAQPLTSMTRGSVVGPRAWRSSGARSPSEPRS